MALARVDGTLLPVSTTLVNPDNDTEPMFLVQTIFQRKKVTWVRVRGRPLDSFSLEDAADPVTSIFQIPSGVVAQTSSCFDFLAHKIHCSNLSASLSHHLASEIAHLAYNLVTIGCFGFFVLANVTIVEETVHVLEPIFDSIEHHVTESRGASKDVLKKLKKERFYMKQMDQSQGHGDSSSGSGTCVVCLEEFSSSVKLTKLPACSHIFHEKCIFRWLRNSKSCPLCRTHVE